MILSGSAWWHRTLGHHLPTDSVSLVPSKYSYNIFTLFCQLLFVHLIWWVVVLSLKSLSLTHSFLLSYSYLLCLMCPSPYSLLRTLLSQLWCLPPSLVCGKWRANDGWRFNPVSIIRLSPPHPSPNSPHVRPALPSAVVMALEAGGAGTSGGWLLERSGFGGV